MPQMLPGLCTVRYGTVRGATTGRSRRLVPTTRACYHSWRESAAYRRWLRDTTAAARSDRRAFNLPSERTSATYLKRRVLRLGTYTLNEGGTVKELNGLAATGTFGKA